MTHRNRILALAILAATACGRDGEGERAAPAPAPPPSSSAAAEGLESHSNELRRDVVRVTDSIAVAIGFGLGNSILVEGETCAFIVDTTESREIAQAIAAEFDQLTDLPIEALIYTHNHADHVFGAEIFASGRDIDIYAHETTAAEVDKAVNIIRPILSQRSARMFGTYLDAGDNGFINAGLGPGLGVTGPNGGSIGYLPPTITFADRLETEICGREVVLQHAPGETDDQIYVFLPDEKVLMPGDNIYKAFPNLYTIRGTSYRDVVKWARSLDAMRAIGAEHLVPSHTRPVSGRETINDLLTAYADGIRFVHDQTVRGMNMGVDPGALVEFVQLPPHLKNHPYLQEYYGTVRWSVRAIYDGYLGWFNGDGAALNPPTRAARAAAMAKIARDQTTLVDAAAEAFAADHFALAAELATLAIDAGDDEDRARALKADALAAMGYQSISPNGRNYLLTQAHELRGRLVIKEIPDERSIAFTRAAPVANFMASLPVNLNAEDALDVERRAEFRFTDTGDVFTVEIRRGVAIVTPAPAGDPDLVVETTSLVWIDLLLGQRRAGVAIATGAIKFPGGLGDVAAFGDFMKLFRAA